MAQGRKLVLHMDISPWVCKPVCVTAKRPQDLWNRLCARAANPLIRAMEEKYATQFRLNKRQAQALLLPIASEPLAMTHVLREWPCAETRHSRLVRYRWHPRQFSP